MNKWQEILVKDGDPYHIKFVKNEQDYSYILTVTNLINVWEEVASSELIMQKYKDYASALIVKDAAQMCLILESYMQDKKSYSVRQNDDPTILDLALTINIEHIEINWIFSSKQLPTLAEQAYFIRQEFYQPAIYASHKLLYVCLNQLPCDTKEKILESVNQISDEKLCFFMKDIGKDCFDALITHKSEYKEELSRSFESLPSIGSLLVFSQDSLMPSFDDFQTPIGTTFSSSQTNDNTQSTHSSLTTEDPLNDSVDMENIRKEKLAKKLMIKKKKGKKRKLV